MNVSSETRLGRAGQADLRLCLFWVVMPERLVGSTRFAAIRTVLWVNALLVLDQLLRTVRSPKGLDECQ